MSNLMNSAPFNPVQPEQQNNLVNTLQDAMRNPAQFEAYIRQNNPQAYQQALQIRNSANPQMLIMQMVQQSGINPNVLRMLGIL